MTRSLMCALGGALVTGMLFLVVELRGIHATGTRQATQPGVEPTSAHQATQPAFHTLLGLPVGKGVTLNDLAEIGQLRPVSKEREIWILVEGAGLRFDEHVIHPVQIRYLFEDGVNTLTVARVSSGGGVSSAAMESLYRQIVTAGQVMEERVHGSIYVTQVALIGFPEPVLCHLDVSVDDIDTKGKPWSFTIEYPGVEFEMPEKYRVPPGDKPYRYRD